MSLIWARPASILFTIGFPAPDSLPGTQTLNHLLNNQTNKNPRVPKSAGGRFLLILFSCFEYWGQLLMSLIRQLKYDCPEIIFHCDPKLFLLRTILPICLPNQTVNSLMARIKFWGSFIRSTNERQTLFQELQRRAVQNGHGSHPQTSMGHPHIR